MKFFIMTWGCQMNEHDSQKLAGTLLAMGFERASAPASADLLLLNTCAVREKASEKVFSELGRLRRRKEGERPPVIGVCGCVAQMEGERIFERVPWVDFVLGPRGINRLPEMIEASKERRRSIDVVHHQESILFPWQITQRSGAPMAYVTIIEGCNKPCAFCVVPATRGPEASRALEDVVAEVRALAENGYREIEFLGQTVNAYRDGAGRRLPALLEAAAGVSGIERIRFTTSHPVHMTEDLARAMRELPKVCPHLHMPAQSGSDRILRKMRRGYDRSGYLRRIEMLREHVPGIEVTTDIIVGFPGETEEDFEQTLSLLDQVGFGTVYGFVYSPRPGTEAAGFAEEVPRAAQDERLARLLDRQREIQEKANRAWIGRTVTVLVDGPSRRNCEEWTGRTPENRIVNFFAPERTPGEFATLRIAEASPYSLRGQPLS